MCRLLPRRKRPTKGGTARLVVRARKEIAGGIPLIPKEIVDRIVAGESVLRVLRNGVVKRSTTSRPRQTSDRAAFPTWKEAGEKGQPLP